MEDLLQVALFTRVRQRVVITEAGRLYLVDVLRILADLKDSTRRIVARGHPGLLSLAVLPTFATRWLIPRLQGFMRENPGATVDLSTRTESFDFVSQPFDAAIHYGTSIWPGAHTHHLMDEETVPVCSPSFKRRHNLRSPEDLKRTTLLHQSTRPEAWASWFHQHHVSESRSVRGPMLEQFAMVAQAAFAGLGVALLPKLLIEEELAAGKLTVLFSNSVKSPHAYYLAVPHCKTTSPLTLVFTQWLVREAHAHT